MTRIKLFAVCTAALLCLCSCDDREEYERKLSEKIAFAQGDAVRAYARCLEHQPRHLCEDVLDFHRDWGLLLLKPQGM